MAVGHLNISVESHAALGAAVGFFTEEKPPLFPSLFLGAPTQLRAEQHLQLRLWEARGRGATVPSLATPFSLKLHKLEAFITLLLLIK